MGCMLTGARLSYILVSDGGAVDSSCFDSGIRDFGGCFWWYVRVFKYWRSVS